ncbi:ATP-binding protein, partial [Streptomyces daliensis]|nr:ATP-binding protein [Streptomyces daliensis]
ASGLPELRYGCGDDIAVRVFLHGRQCVIEVDDGSPDQPEPRDVGHEDESGRGLLLVAALAEDWGVRANGSGTTTWCTLPLTEGPRMQATASTSPVEREMELSLPADFKAVPGARINGPAALTVLEWSGNVPAAIDVLHCLVDNAVRHDLTPGRPNESIGAWLRVTEAHELLIDVTGPNPTFPDAEHVLAGKAEGSLRDVAQVATLSWFMNADGTGKTVRAVLRPGRVEL